MTAKDDLTEGGDNLEKVARFKAALDQLIERIAEDRYVLAVVLVGSLSPETVWHRESLGLWIIEADGVSRRLPSDGKDERVFRILVENGINIHAEVIPRSRFKTNGRRSVADGVFLQLLRYREIVYSQDPSIASWFKKANSIATKDQERELLTFSTWTIHALRHARKRLDIKGDLELAAQEIVGGRAQRGAHRNHPPGPGVGTRRHLSGDRRGPGALSDNLSRRAGQAQESARALQGARRDRRISRQALPGSPETAARLSQKGEPGGSAVGNERPLRLLADVPVAPGIGVRMAGTQRACCRNFRLRSS